MITIEPETFTKVDFDRELIHTVAQRALESVAPLPDDLDVAVAVDEDQATNRVKIVSVDPVELAVDGGALENYRQPRTVGDLETNITFIRLFLELSDRLSESFGAPELDAKLSHAHRMAWDVNLFGRVSRHGMRIHQPRYLYNFRNRHGFSDVADRAFDQLWAADELTFAQIVELSDGAVDTVVTGG
ncbi:MAG: hypothetical protein AAGA65_10510 [Actinomycetota bacterium]